MANALALCPAASIGALARRMPEPCVPMSERASVSAVYSIKQRTLYLAFAKRPFATCGDACRLRRGSGTKGLSLCPTFALREMEGCEAKRASMVQGGSGALFCGEGGGVRERCSRVEGGLSPKALAKPPSTREVGRAARRSPACCAREVPVPALAAGRQGACAPAARKPRQRARAAGGKSCSNGVAAGQATTRFSPA